MGVAAVPLADLMVAPAVAEAIHRIYTTHDACGGLGFEGRLASGIPAANNLNQHAWRLHRHCITKPRLQQTPSSGS